MLKRIILAVAVIFPMSIFAQKFGVVNLDEVFQAMPETAQMTTSLSEASKKYESEFQQLQQELEKLFAEYQALNQDATTPESIKQRRVQDIQERQQKVDQFRMTAQQDLERLQNQLVAPIQQKAMAAVQTVGQEGDFTFIFPKNEMMILYQGATVIDVTNEVKAKLGLK